MSIVGQGYEHKLEMIRRSCLEKDICQSELPLVAVSPLAEGVINTGGSCYACIGELSSYEQRIKVFRRSASGRESYMFHSDCFLDFLNGVPIERRTNP